MCKWVLFQYCYQYCFITKFLCPCGNTQIAIYVTDVQDLRKLFKRYTFSVNNIVINRIVPYIYSRMFRIQFLFEFTCLFYVNTQRNLADMLTIIYTLEPLWCYLRQVFFYFVSMIFNKMYNYYDNSSFILFFDLFFIFLQKKIWSLYTSYIFLQFHYKIFYVLFELKLINLL